MSKISYNPYIQFADVFKGGLDYIIQNSSPDSTIDDLSNLCLWYVISVFPEFAGSPPEPIYSGGGSGVPSPTLNSQLTPLLVAITPNVANDYMNLKVLKVLGRDTNQISVVTSIMRGIKFNTPDSYDNFFNDVDENISSCNCSNMSKISLFLSSAMARGSSQYWLALLASGDVSGWDNYLYSSFNAGTNRGNWAANYINLPTWVTATLSGSVSGYGQIQYPAYKPGYLNDGAVSGAFAGALTGALALSAGKLFFKWPQGIGSSCNGSNRYNNNYPMNKIIR